MQSRNLFELAARLGFAARGLMYMAIGYMALRLGQTSSNADALSFIEGEGGKVLLAVMAIGFAGYGIWRISEALLDAECNGSGAKGIVKRLGGAVSGVIHLALAAASIRLIMDIGGGGMDPARRGASTALSFPGGAIALMIAAAILLVVGAYQLIKAIKLGFLKHLDRNVADRPWIAWLGRAGYLSRGVVFVLTAMFTWQAGDQSRSAAAGSTEKALDTLPESLRLIVAAGFVMFGIFSLVEARYRRISNPDLVGEVRRLAA